MDFLLEDLPVADIRQLKLEATQRLLGSTIQISGPEWESASHLPGWTRAHVAAHLARNAEALQHLVDDTLAGRPARLYKDARSKRLAIERTSEQTPLELQIDLDTTANNLARSLDRVPADQWDLPIRLDGGVHPLKYVAVCRLTEVVLHHIDLDFGFVPDDIDDDSAEWMLRWTIARLYEVTPHQPFRIETDDGRSVVIGAPQWDLPTVSGTPKTLSTWLTGRAPDSAVRIAGDVHSARIG
jgi:maleylpyruvate isomerase